MAAGRGQRAAFAHTELPLPLLRTDFGALWRSGITAPARPACIEWVSPGRRNVCGVARGLYLSAALIPKGSAGLPKAVSGRWVSGRSRRSYAATAPSPATCAAFGVTCRLRRHQRPYDADTSDGNTRPPKRSLTLPPC